MAILAPNPAAWPQAALTGLLPAAARTPCISDIISSTLIRIGGLCTVTDVKWQEGGSIKINTAAQAN